MEPMLGIEEGGLHSAEALLLARYFMFTQVYLHPIRRIYDIHLKDFLIEWLNEKKFFKSLDNYLSLTDNQILTEIININTRSRKKKPGSVHAERILKRDHFKLLYEKNPEDGRINPEASHKIYEECVSQFGQSNVRRDYYYKGASKINHFPVQRHDGSIESVLSLSKTLSQIPPFLVDYVFIESSLLEKATVWLKKCKNDIIKLP